MTNEIEPVPESTDKTYLGIDYGNKRIGVSKSDPTGLIASGLTTLEVKSIADALKKLTLLIEEHKPEKIIVGYPLHTDGTKSKKCLEVDSFIEKLEEIYNGPICRVDEGHSSLEAQEILHLHGKRVGKNKKVIDRLAAVIILQRFLDE